MKKVDPQLRNDEVELMQAGSNVRTRALTELDELTEQIWQDLRGQVPSARIRQVVLEVASQFHDATVTMYLPIFIRRLTRERLEEERCGDSAGNGRRADRSSQLATEKATVSTVPARLTRLT